MDNIINFDRAKLEKDLARNKVKDQFAELEPRLMKLPQYRGRVPSKTFLSKDPLIKKGQCYWIESENGLFTVVKRDKKGVQLRPLDMNATVSTGYTIYEMNQAMTAKEPLLDLGDWEHGDFSDELNDIEDDMITFFDETENEFYLMYGRDLHYFTVFKIADEPHNCFVEQILSCLTHTWDIVSIDVDMSEEDGMPKIEIWVRDRRQEGAAENALANHMLYVMPFDGNVVEL